MSKLRSVIDILKNFNPHKTMFHLNLNNEQLREVKLDTFHCYKVATMMQQKNNGIVVLSLEGNQIDDDGIKILADAFANENCDVKNINLSHNNIGPRGTKYLIDAVFDKSCSVESVNLNNNNAGNAGAIFIADAFNEGKCISNLILDNNGIGRESMSLIYTTLMQLKETESIRVSLLNNPGCKDDCTLNSSLFTEGVDPMQVFKKQYGVSPEMLSEIMGYNFKDSNNLPAKENDTQLTDELTLNQRLLLNAAILEGECFSTDDYSTISDSNSNLDLSGQIGLKIYNRFPGTYDSDFYDD